MNSTDSVTDLFFKNYIPSVSRTMDYIRNNTPVSEDRWGYINLTRGVFRTLIRLGVRYE